MHLIGMRNNMFHKSVGMSLTYRPKMFDASPNCLSDFFYIDFLQSDGNDEAFSYRRPCQNTKCKLPFIIVNCD